MSLSKILIQKNLKKSPSGLFLFSLVQLSEKPGNLFSSVTNIGKICDRTIIIFVTKRNYICDK